MDRGHRLHERERERGDGRAGRRRTRRRSGAWWGPRSACRRRRRSTSPRGSSARGCRWTASRPGSRASRRLSRRRRRPSPPRLPRSGRRIRGRRSPRRRSGSPARTVRPSPCPVTGIAKGVGMIHPRMATMLVVVMTDASDRAGHAPRDAPRSDRPDVGPAERRRRHEHERHGLPRRVREPRPRSRGGRIRRRRPAPRRPWRRSPGTSHASRRLTARARRRSSRCRVTGAADDVDARAVARSVVVQQPREGGGPRPRPELGPGRGRRGQCRRRRGRDPRGRRPRSRPRRQRPRGLRGGGRPGIACGSRSPGTSSTTARRGRPRPVRPRGGTRRDGRPRGRHRPRPGSRRRVTARRSGAT